MNYYIVTGTSRGLGEAIARQLISEDNYLFCISRNRNDLLINEAESSNCTIEYFEYDLECIEGIDKLIEQIFRSINSSEAESINLINNASILNPIKPIGSCNSTEIISNMKINSIAPMILTSQFIKHTEVFACSKVVINISSGAGKTPYYGWGSYCSSKAAIDMYTRCIGVEQVNRGNPVKIISFAPGILDTEMQEEIRQTNVKDFEQVDRFIKFKEDGVLRQPYEVAQILTKLLGNKNIKTGILIDIKELTQ